MKSILFTILLIVLEFIVSRFYSSDGLVLANPALFIGGGLLASSIIGGLMSKNKGPSVSQAPLYTPDQQAYIKNLTGMMNQQLPGALSGMAGMATLGSSYEAMPDFETQYQQMYGAPMDQKFNQTMGNIQSGPERHSSARLMRENDAVNNYMVMGGQQRSMMLEQERLRRMEAEEKRRQTQMSAYGGIMGMAGVPLAKSYENVVTPGSNSTFSNIMSSATQGLGMTAMLGNISNMNFGGSSGMATAMK